MFLVPRDGAPPDPGPEDYTIVSLRNPVGTAIPVTNTTTFIFMGGSLLLAGIRETAPLLRSRAPVHVLARIR